MQLKELDTVYCDILIIGGGGASLRAAVEAKELGAEVAIASKAHIGRVNNTFIAGSNIAASGITGIPDDTDAHLKDTVLSGRFLNDQNLARFVIQKGKEQIPYLEAHGVQLAREDGQLQVEHWPGHTNPRHVHAPRRRGLEYTLPLAEIARRSGVRFLEKTFITKLFTSNNRIAGASGVTDKGEFVMIQAACVILGTGGFSQIYSRNNNVPGITGDGVVLAYELGVPLMDMEFVQFYPTGLGRTGGRLIGYELLVFDAGAKIRNSRNEDVLAKHGLDDILKGTRDRITQTITQEISAGLGVDGGLLVDLSPISEGPLKKRLIRRYGNWESSGKFPVVAPTAHFSMGGIRINQSAGTKIPGLFAAGEVCAGMHGANRLAGNALAEVFVMGGIAAKSAAAKANEWGSAEKIPSDLIAEEKQRLESSPSQDGKDAKTLTQMLKTEMWEGSGVIRTGDGLSRSLSRIEEIRHLSWSAPKRNNSELKQFLELGNMLKISEMVCRSALLRTESRGSHFRSDFPEEDNANQLNNIVIQKQDDQMKISTTPVSFERIPFDQK